MNIVTKIFSPDGFMPHGQDLKAALDRWGVMPDNRASAAGGETGQGPVNQKNVPTRPNEPPAEEPIAIK